MTKERLEEMRLRFPHVENAIYVETTNTVGHVTPSSEPEPQEKETKMEKVYTIIAVKLPSLLEQQQGAGTVILAGPQTLPSKDALTAAMQFGAMNADKLAKAPAGLLVAQHREGV